jgi:hypothetical protein
MSNFEQSFYAVLNEDTNTYFGGFDSESNQPIMVEDPKAAKLFSNKNQVKLRPNEKLVELVVVLDATNTTVSAPFRPRRRPMKASS